MDPGEQVPPPLAESGDQEGDIAADADAGVRDAMLTPGQESVDTLDKGALSPLTGSYLLIVLAEPHTDEDREIIIKRLIKGLRSWDLDTTHVDLTCELLNLANAAPASDEARNGEKLVQWASENLVVEVLIHCQVNTLLQCMKNLLSSFTRHRHIIHAGYTFQGSGSWILQDGTFSFTDFVELWDEPEVHRILGAYRGDISVSLHCAEENGWTDDQLGQESFTKLCQVWMNPEEKISGHSSGIISFVDYISKMVQPAPLKEILEPSDIVGNIRFSHPTLYVFPGGQGDAALFGVNGFNMLVDGGFSRRSCFWDFTRHLDRLDAVLLTRVNNNAVGGLDSLMDRKRVSQVYPQIGHFFGNVMERRMHHHDSEKDTQETKFSSSNGDLLVSLTDTGQRILDNLRNINIRPQHCFREHTIDPINLYHKVGHGKLDMYVLNPAKDSKEVREFLSKWNTNCKSFVQARMNVKVEGKEMNYPVLNLVSICALLVWQPDNPREPITRILFPGSTPQQKIFEALGKLKHLEFLKFPICSAKTIAASHKSRSKSERIVSEARSHLKTGDSVTTDSAKVSMAPSESRVTSSRYSSSLYAGVRSKVTSSQRSDSSSTIQTAEEKDKDKERKGRERSREKRKVKDVKDNKEIEEVKRRTTKSRVDSGLTESKTVRSRSKSKTKSNSKPKVDSTVKKISPSSEVIPASGEKESIITTTTKKSNSSSRYGIAASLSTRTVVSKSSAATPGTMPPPQTGTATPPKAAKNATKRKVVEHKVAATRKPLVEKSKESASSKEKVSSKPPPAPKTTAVNPSTQSPTTAKKTTTSSEKGAVLVKRPGTAKAATAAVIGGVAVAAVATTLAKSPEKEEKYEAKQEEAEVGPDKLTVEDVEMDKDLIEEEALRPQTNGFQSSAASVPESGSELSSLEHVIDYEVEEREDISQPESRTGTELSEDVSGSEDIETVESKTAVTEAEEVAKAPESETHTITEHEPEETAYEEEEEYLVIEKDESAGAEEAADQVAPEEEKGAIEEKEAEEKEEAEAKKQTEEILDEENAIPEPEKARKSESEDAAADQPFEEIVKSGSATEVKAPEGPDGEGDEEGVQEEIVEDPISFTKIENSAAVPIKQEDDDEAEGEQELDVINEEPAEEQTPPTDDKEATEPPPSPDNKDGLKLDVELENEEGPLSPASSPVKETAEGKIDEEEEKVEELIDTTAKDINAQEKKVEVESTEKVEAEADILEKISVLAGEIDEEKPGAGELEPELFENKEEPLTEALHDEVIQAALEMEKVDELQAEKILENIEEEEKVASASKLESSKDDAEEEEGDEAVPTEEKIDEKDEAEAEEDKASENDEDDKHSVKSDLEDKKSVVSISPAKSTEEIHVPEKAYDGDEDDKHSTKSGISAEDTEKEKAALSPALSTHDLKDKDGTLPVATTDSHEDDKKSTRSVSPAQEQELEQELEQEGEEDEKVGESGE